MVHTRFYSHLVCRHNPIYRLHSRLVHPSEYPFPRHSENPSSLLSAKTTEKRKVAPVVKWLSLQDPAKARAFISEAVDGCTTPAYSDLGASISAAAKNVLTDTTPEDSPWFDLSCDTPPLITEKMRRKVILKLRKTPTLILLSPSLGNRQRKRYWWRN